MERYHAMKNKPLALTYFIVFTACSVVCAFGRQSASSPFAELDNQIEKQHGWGPVQLREAAIEAARQWIFRPVELAGQAVRMSGVLSFNFAPK
jgi:hypothetical protein